MEGSLVDVRQSVGGQVEARSVGAPEAGIRQPRQPIKVQVQVTHLLHNPMQMFNPWATPFNSNERDKSNQQPTKFQLFPCR